MYEQPHLLRGPVLCEGFSVRGSVAQLLLKADGNFTQRELWRCPTSQPP